jgi:hypothetical protein
MKQVYPKIKRLKYADRTQIICTICSTVADVVDDERIRQKHFVTSYSCKCPTCKVYLFFNIPALAKPTMKKTYDGQKP